MTLPVKYFHSDMQGAPTLNNSAGSMIALLDACLLNGFNLITLDSLTWDSVAGEATGTLSTGHGFEVDQVIAIAGAAESAYNDEHRVTWVDTTTFKITPATGPSGDATGTLTAKAAPIGNWSKAHDDGLGTKAAYTSTDPQATANLLRVDDTNTKSGWNNGSGSPARTWVEGAENMTDIDTVTGSFGGGWWGKNRTDTNNCRWSLVGDALGFYFIPWIAAGPNPAGFCFTDFDSVRAGDAYNTLLITGSESGQNWGSTSANNWSALTTLPSNWNKTTARAWHQLPGAVSATMAGSGLSDTLGATAGLPYPNPDDNSFYFVGNIAVMDEGLRGTAPGLQQPLHLNPLADRTHINNIADTTSALLIYIQITADKDGQGMGAAMFDLKGPWR